MKFGILTAAFVGVAFSAFAGEEPPVPPGQEINALLSKAPASAWLNVPPADLMIMKLGDGATVTIQLAPQFAPVHVENIKRLVRAGRFDSTSVVRVQDNYVTQWTASESKTNPSGFVEKPPAEYEMAGSDAGFRPLGYPDAYAPKTGHIATWPAAEDGKAHWLVHCYATVAVGRDFPPDTGSGAELYTVIGHSPRHLDRNLAVVGRVLAGMDAMSSLPRGKEAMGFYGKDPAAMKIVSTKMASDLPAAERPAFQVLDTNTPTFAAWAKFKAARKSSFDAHTSEGLDICNAQTPVRKTP